MKNGSEPSETTVDSWKQVGPLYQWIFSLREDHLIVLKFI
jgi:hypothetical protein